MIVTFVAASLATVQPQAVPPVDHGKMDHGKMGQAATGKDAASPTTMGCCKDGCACCAKDKSKPAL